MTLSELVIIKEFIEEATTHYFKQRIWNKVEKGNNCLKLIERDIKLKTMDPRKKDGSETD